MTRDLTTLAGVKIEFNSEVVNVDADAGTVQLANGRTYSADLIVGADGPNSVAREAIVGEKEELEIGPHCTYSSVLRLRSYRCVLRVSHHNHQICRINELDDERSWPRIVV